MGRIRDLMNRQVARNQEKQAMQASVRNNPNATTKDYLQAGMGPGSIIAAKARARQATTPLPGTGFGTAIDRLRASSTRNQIQPTAPGQSGFARMASNAMAARGVAPISPMQPTPISPTAFSNQDAIGGMFGAANEGTFTRTVGDTPLMQMADPGYMPMEDPSMTGADVALDQYGQAQMPPMEVQTPITPTYDLNNL
jgi:hypothetical protein